MSKKHYKVWIEVEEIDEENDLYEKVPVEFGATAVFDTEQEALDFAEELHNRAMNKMHTLEKEIKKRFEDNARHNEGSIETLRARIEELENAVSHLMAFIAFKFRLREDEIDCENGLTDF